MSPAPSCPVLPMTATRIPGKFVLEGARPRRSAKTSAVLVVRDRLLRGRSLPVDGWFPVLLAVFVTIEVLRSGLPELRHDWLIPSMPDAVGPWLASLWNGWVSTGIGAPQPYPTFYLVGFALWPLHTILGT